MPRRVHRRSLFAALAIVAVTTAGCHKADVEIDQARLEAETETRFAAAAESPKVNAALDALIARVIADPTVVGAGQGLLTAVGADADVQAGAAAIMGRLGEDPAVQASTRALMAAHPEATADQIGDLAGAQIGKVTDGPIFDRAWMRAWNELLATPEMSGAMRRFGERVGHSPQVVKAIETGVKARVHEKAILDRLVELNHGDVPDRDHATTLLLDHAFTVDRLAGFYQRVIALGAVEQAVTGLVRDLASAPAFQREAVVGLRAMLADDDFRARATDVMVALLDPAITEDRLYQVLHRLLATPAVVKAFSGLVDHLLGDPELGDIGGRALTKIVDDPSFQAALVGVFEGW